MAGAHKDPMSRVISGLAGSIHVRPETDPNAWSAETSACAPRFIDSAGRGRLRHDHGVDGRWWTLLAWLAPAHHQGDRGAPKDAGLASWVEGRGVLLY